MFWSQPVRDMLAGGNDNVIYLINGQISDNNRLITPVQALWTEHGLCHGDGRRSIAIGTEGLEVTYHR